MREELLKIMMVDDGMAKHGTHEESHAVLCGEEKDSDRGHVEASTKRSRVKE